VKWPPACEDVRPGAEERPLFEDVTENTGLCVIVICKVQLRVEC
jgi:hypothetical protein